MCGCASCALYKDAWQRDDWGLNLAWALFAKAWNGPRHLKEEAPFPNWHKSANYVDSRVRLLWT